MNDKKLVKESDFCMGDHPRQKSVFTAASKFNISAPPFILKQEVRDSQLQRNVDAANDSEPTIRVGLTQVPVNSRIWSQIAANPDPHPYFDNLALRRGDEWNRENFNYNFSEMLNSLTMEADYPAQAPAPARRPSRLEIPKFQPVETQKFGPIAKPDGTIELSLKHSIKVSFTLDKAVMVHNQANNIKIALSNNMSSSSLQHPNGRVHQQLERVDIRAYDGMKRNSFVRYARMYHKGVSLTSDGCALIYLVDDAGTRTTSDAINIDVYSDQCAKVFMNNSKISPVFAPEAWDIVDCYQYWLHDDGTENFEINGFRVSQTGDGLVKISRMNSQCVVRTSPKNGSATLTTPYIHCTASLGNTSHLFVRRGERRMHFDGASFVVRNAGHSAGFDEKNLLRVY